jgi:hypothetical protein
MATTAKQPVTLPTPEELKEASEALYVGASPLTSIAWRVERVGGIDEEDDSLIKRQDGDEVPTFEHLGRLFSFVLDARLTLQELEDTLERVSEGLRDLDYTRALGGKMENA